jgi:thiol-disulfide isomerase/thioredoxin
MRNGRRLLTVICLISFLSGTAISLGMTLHGQNRHGGDHGHGVHGALRSVADSAWTNSPIVVELSNVQGITRNFPADYGAERYLVNFWATWCPPCVHELPLLSEFHDSQAEDGLVVIGIAIDEPGKVRKFLDERPIGFESLIAGATRFDLLPRKEGVPPYLPASFLVDLAGNVLEQKAGPFADIAEISGFVKGKNGAN